MQYPNFKDKHSENTLLEPQQYLEYLKERKRYPTHKPPRGVILCYQSSLLSFIKENHPTQACDGFLPKLLFLKERHNEVAVIGGFGVGAPVASIILEELIAFGVSDFISLGTAGTLQSHIKIGDLVLCDRAIRDEGTSHHYLPPGKFSYSSKTLTERLAQTLKKQGTPFHTGSSWTTDAPYRETVAEAKLYQSKGVATVEMEAAALFAVAEFRKVSLAAAFTISDSLADLKWHPEFHSTKTRGGLEKLYQAALAAF